MQGVAACSSDDYSRDQFVEMPEGNWLEFIDQRTGYVTQKNGKWLIYYYIPNTIDAFIEYYPVHLGREFCYIGCKVTFSGYTYEYDSRYVLTDNNGYIHPDYQYTIILKTISKE